ncbi:MAG: hypothetical protein ACRC5C_03685 [Bacilli bacterium]
MLRTIVRNEEFAYDLEFLGLSVNTNEGEEDVEVRVENEEK